MTNSSIAHDSERATQIVKIFRGAQNAEICLNWRYQGNSLTDALQPYYELIGDLWPRTKVSVSAPPWWIGNPP